MEQVEAIPEGEWNGFCGIYSTDQESDFMSQLFGNNSSVPNDPSSGVSIYETPSHFYPSHEPNMISIVSGAEPNNFYNFSSRGGSGGIVSNSGCTSSSIFFPTSSHESSYFLPGGDSSSSSHHQFLAMNDSSCMSIDFFVGEDRNIGNVMEESGGSMEDSGEEDKVVPVLVPEQFPEEEKSTITKRSRVSGDVQKKRNVKPKKKQKVVDSSDEENKVVAVLNRQTSGSCCSEDESKPSALNLNGKSRASRGSATDPQSLYARKRRERINERLRMLQNLVPNGTKVDISTMLEEAVQYVKFLQLQIKLLSSDDMWMYAPIAYNGMDLGLDRTTPFPRG